MYHPTRSKIQAKRIYQIIGIALLCILLVICSYGVTLAWFVDQSITSNGSPSILVVGTVDLNVRTNFNFYNLVLAPDTLYKENIEDGQTVSYATTVSTGAKNDTGNIYVRARFSTNRPELSLYFENLTTETNYENAINNWYYNEEIDSNNDGTPESGDGWYYYIGSVGATSITFNSGYYVDNTLHNGVAGETVTIDFVFEAIQRPYGAYNAVWTSAPSVFDDFASQDKIVNTENNNA